jgi:predicted transcriptional regulator
MTRTRLNVYLERDHSKRVDELAAMKRLSRSSIVAAALASFLSPEGGERREAATARRLDKLARQFERLERDQTILIETVALYVRYYLSVTTPIPEEHQDAARAQGRGRFEQFIEQLGRHLQRGGSLVKEVYEEFQPDDSDPARPHAVPSADAAQGPT